MTSSIDARIRSLALGLSLGLMALLFGGCSGTQTHTYSLTMPEGMVRLAVDVENYSGHVEVIADDNARGVTVDGWIWLGAEALAAGGDEPYTLTNVDARIERSPDVPSFGVLRVRSTTEHSEFHDHHVRLVIRAPRVDGLRIVNRNGFVEVADARGAVEIENASGGIQFRSSNPMVDPVQILASDTNIWYQVPAGSTGEVVLETLQGRAIYKNDITDSDNTYTTMSQDGNSGSIIRTVLDDGTNPVNIRTNRGDIRLFVMEEPLEYKVAFDWQLPELREYWRQGGSKNFTRNRPDDDYETPERNLGMTD